MGARIPNLRESPTAPPAGRAIRRRWENGFDATERGQGLTALVPPGPGGCCGIHSTASARPSAQPAQDCAARPPRLEEAGKGKVWGLRRGGRKTGGSGGRVSQWSWRARRRGGWSCSSPAAARQAKREAAAPRAQAGRASQVDRSTAPAQNAGAACSAATRRAPRGSLANVAEAVARARQAETPGPRRTSRAVARPWAAVLGGRCLPMEAQAFSEGPALRGAPWDPALQA